MSNTFKNVITTEEELREVIGHPSSRVTDKVIDYIDDVCASFIDASPFMVISSADKDGNLALSPKGGPPGFVMVYDQKTLLVPDRPGNKRADTLSNILQNPKIGAFFMVPGKRETLRVSGTAQIVRDEDLLRQFIVKGKPPILLIAITVEEAFFHCAKCVVRSQIWDVRDLKLPSLAEAMVKHGDLDITVGEMQAIIEKDEHERLY